MIKRVFKPFRLKENMRKEAVKTMAIVTLFAIAMAFLESAVVAYIREIFYGSEGFSFPLKGFIDSQVIEIEWIREAFTIVMLLCVAYLAGKKLHDRFAYFIYAFAVWDIFYYIWLKVILGWPSSLMTWDVLFLIPWAWTGPVLAPLIVSATFIIFATVIWKKDLKIKFVEWSLFICGMLLILYTFVIDYGLLLFTNPEQITSYIPTNYHWIIFVIGELLGVCAIIKLYLRKK